MTHASDATSALAELLRRNRTAQTVLRALKLAPLSVPELAVVARRNEAAVRSACRSLRLAGLVVRLERRVKLRNRGTAKVWRIR
jgi:predicted transcriptional regulator